jgi:predicted dehydrogenase
MTRDTSVPKIRWGVLATGGIAATFTEALRSLPDAEVVAVGSRSPEGAKAFAERHGIPRAHGSWAELAADPEVDVVYVATPHSAHRAAAGLCLEAGKPVLCEKAFTINEREARELVELAQERGLFLMEAMWTYCNPLIRNLVALVADGVIGEVRQVSAHFGFPGDFEPGHRMRDPRQGGGALLDLGVYPVAFAQLLLGEPDEVQSGSTTPPASCSAGTVAQSPRSPARSPRTPARPPRSPGPRAASTSRTASSTPTASPSTGRARPRAPCAWPTSATTTTAARCATRPRRSCAACARARPSPRWSRWRVRWR